MKSSNTFRIVISSIGSGSLEKYTDSPPNGASDLRDDLIEAYGV